MAVSVKPSKSDPVGKCAGAVALGYAVFIMRFCPEQTRQGGVLDEVQRLLPVLVGGVILWEAHQVLEDVDVLDSDRFAYSPSRRCLR